MIEFGQQLPLLASVFSASLLGSLHCAGMCGPFVAFYAAVDGGPKTSVRKIGPMHAAYHFGRAGTYGLVGAIGGLIGSFVDWAGEVAGVARIAALASSLLLIAWGMGVLFPRLRIRSPWDDLLGRRLVQLRRRSPLVRASLLGALTPLLPCGWFYAFAVTAAGTGSPALGATVMVVFWIGTVPALLGVGAIMSHLGHFLRSRLPVVTGIALICVGVVLVLTRLSHPLQIVEGSSQFSSPNPTVPHSGEVRCH